MTAQQLKNSILQMAVQGKLVPQDPNDEPASVLLERIRAEKEKLIKEGKIKKEKNPSVIFRGEDNLPYEKVGNNEPVCIADEVPFEIPESWEWVRLKNIVNVVSARRVHQSDWKTSGVPFYRAREIGTLSEYGHVNNELFISEELYAEFSKSGVPQKDDLMITAVGTLGKVYIVKETDRFYYKDASVICLENFGRIIPEYLKIVIHSPYLATLIKKKSAGTTVDTITIINANEYLIPIPPLNEQARIVFKLQECIPALENYNKKETSLSNMNIAFPELLKKSILQQAVMGKLVPQDPDDEPASILLEKIRAEKEALIKAGKLKKDKHESIIYRRDNSHYEKVDGIERCIDDEIPFEIPDNWVWCRLKDIVDYTMGKTPPRKETEYWCNPCYKWVSIADMIDGGIVNETKEMINQYAAKNTFKGRISPAGTLIMSFKLTVGKVSLLGIDAYHNEAIISIFPYIDSHKCMTEYLFKVLPLMSRLGETKTAIKGNTLNSESLDALLIPLPPVNEQIKISKKISELVPLCTCIRDGVCL